jgi:hypothetical protein
MAVATYKKYPTAKLLSRSTVARQIYPIMETDIEPMQAKARW